LKPPHIYFDVKLIATTRPGKEEKAEIEILDALVRHDRSVEVLRTGYPGVLLVRTALGPDEALRAVRSMEMAYVEHVFPLHAVVQASPGSIEEACVRLAREIRLRPGLSFAVRCRRRGRAIKSSSELERALGKAIMEATGARVDLEKPDVLFRIEVVGDVAGISVLRARLRDTPPRPGTV